MNRAVWTITEPKPKELLPPPTAPEKRVGRPRILFIHGSELGFATTAANLERCAAARDDLEAVHVRVPMTGLTRRIATALPFNTFTLDQQPYRMLWAVRRLLRGLFRDHLDLSRFDVVHFMTQQKAYILPELKRSPAALKCRFAINADSTSPAYYRAFDVPLRPWALELKVEKPILQAADLVACASRWVSDSMVRDEGVDPGRIILHKPCAIRDATMPTRIATETPPRGQPNASGTIDPVRIAFVGNDWVRKGGPRLLAWHQQHFRDRARIHVCSRTAPQDHALHNVVWHGQTPHATLMTEILPSCDLFVMPTRNDTFLIAAQEAQAVGVPVVTSRLAGIPEVVRHARTGYLCNPDDDAAFIRHIGELIDDWQLRRRMSSAALEHASKNLSGEIWHNHLLTQLVRLADDQPPLFAPENVDVRRDDAEPASSPLGPRSQAESLALAPT